MDRKSGHGKGVFNDVPSQVLKAHERVLRKSAWAGLPEVLCALCFVVCGRLYGAAYQ